VHICDAAGKKILERLVGSGAAIDPEAFVNSTIQEIVDLHPDFVVATGDLVVEARGSAPKDILSIYELFNRSVQPLTKADIPFYPIIGNHDVVGVFNKTLDASEPGYGKGMFMKVFCQNRTFYSFDRNGYHFVALDPNSYEL
jgi:3',5'-cyclic AMP phosphodiesterase CpdA